MAGRPDAPNLVGASLEESIVTQFERRAEVLAQTGIRTDKDLTYLSNKNCWVRLTSFVKVLPSGLEDIANNIGKEFEIKGGTYLAQQWALKSEQKQGNNSRYGVNNITGAYGSGGINEIGYRPMPGIHSISIESQPPLGAVNSATVKLKAWNLNQLSMLDILYFRLGFSMLLEWGHSVFLDNKGNLINNATPIDAFTDLTKEQVMQQLAAKRVQYAHNYDGMLGLVTNYEWSQNVDGSYDCTLRLSGIGSIIESLKINTQDATPNILPASTDPLLRDSLVVSTGVINNVTKYTQVEIPADSSITVFASRIQNAWAKDALEDKIFPELFSGGLDLLNNPTMDFKYGYNTKYMSLSNGSTVPPAIPLADFLGLKVFVKADIIKLEGTSTTHGAARYIPLATLLAYITNSCIIYDKSNNEKKPAIYIDFNQNSNFCLRLPQQFSVDPGVCLIDLDCTDTDYSELFSIRGIATEQIDPVTPAIGKLKDTIAAAKVSYIDSSNASRGKFMNILVNADCIKTTIDENTDSNKNVFLSQFLSALMQKIQVAIGNINNFKIGYDETANTVTIYDAQLVDMESRDRPIPTLPVFGLKSIVREYNLKTEASSKLGSMLAITARAGARNTGANIDNAAFTVLNQSLEDRLFVGVSTNPRGSNDSQVGSTEDLIGVQNLGTTFDRQIMKLYEITTKNISYDVGSVEAIKQFYITSMLLIKGKTSNKPGEIDSVTATGILPLALNITLDGIGGIPLFQAFTVPANRLPAQYVNKGKPRVGFTIAGLTHTIENNQWTTAIRGLMINIPNSRRVYTPSYKPTTRTEKSQADKPAIIPVPLSTAEVSDFDLFFYMAWQQGAGGAAQHYSLWKKNGRYTNYTKNVPVRNIVSNWPGGFRSSKGVTVQDVDKLYNSNQSALAEAFIDVQRQLYGKKAAAAAVYINSGGKNRTGVPYASIKAAFTQHADPGAGLTAASLANFGMIENGLNTDSRSTNTFQTMFQVNKTYDSYAKAINRQTQKAGSEKSYTDYGTIEQLAKDIVPLAVDSFRTFKNLSGFVG